MSLQADKQAEKASKKQAKKEKQEKQQQELERLSDMLRLQCLLENLGTEEIRTDLCAGRYGSVVSTVLLCAAVLQSCSFILDFLKECVC